MAMPWWLRNEQTRALVQPLPRPVGLPARLRSRAICWSGIRRANSRISNNVSSGIVQRCLPTLFILSVSAVWSPPCQCKTISMKPPSTRTTISCSAARQILLRVAALPARSQPRGFRGRDTLHAARGTATQATDRDAPLRAVVHESALAEVPPRLASIAHIQLAAAMATAQEPCEKQPPAPHRSSDRRTTLAGLVVGNHLLVPLELAPGDIALVLILEQHVPFGHWAPQAALDALAAILDTDLAHRAPKSIRTRIDMVGQNIVHGVVERQSTHNAASLRRAMTCNGQCNAIVAQPHVHLSHALQFGELGED